MSIFQPQRHSGLQLVAWDTHAPPVANTWYTVLTVNGPCELLFALVMQKNDEAAAKNVEIEFTIDGVVYPATAAALTDGAVGSALVDLIVPESVLLANHTLLNDNSANPPLYSGDVGFFALKCKSSFSVRYRQTTAVGTNQTLNCTIRYNTL